MYQTIGHAFLSTTDRQPDRVAVLHRPDPSKPVWTTVSWAEYRHAVEAVASGLIASGVQPGHRVAILSGTRWKWAVADLAIMGVGAVTVPIYQNSSPDDIALILNDSGSDVLLCENQAAVDRFLPLRSTCPAVRLVVQMDDEAPAPAGSAAISWVDLIDRGTTSLAARPDLYRTEVEGRASTDIATIVYTSGTTGQPKGAELTHAQLMSAFVDVHELRLSPDDVSLTFLPFAHIAGRVEHFAHVYIGYCMGVAASIEQLREHFLEVRPTFIAAVPRLFEKIYDAATARAGATRTTQAIFDWAVRVGQAVSDELAAGRRIGPWLAVRRRIARRLVFDRITRGLGGRLRFALSGGAPLSLDLLRFFHGAGIIILEGYGLTETTAAVAMNAMSGYRFGSVGRAIGDVQIRIADDGEILVRSTQVMKGYHDNPEATRTVLSAEGWLATGDIGALSDDGYLRITDRKKDLIKTAGGKYVAPQKLENLLKLSRYVSNVLVHGDTRRFIVALIFPAFDELSRFARDRRLGAVDPQQLVHHPQIRRLLADVVADANARLASYETIKRFDVLPRDLSVEAGELTPSMKIRRRECDRKYVDVIERLYDVPD